MQRKEPKIRSKVKNQGLNASEPAGWLAGYLIVQEAPLSAPESCKKARVPKQRIEIKRNTKFTFPNNTRCV